MSNLNERRHPSRFAANLYLMVGIAALILTGGSDTTLAHYVIGSAVEIGLALLILLFLRVENVPARSALRIRRPDSQTLGLAVALVPALWLAGITLNLLAVMIFGYVTPMPPLAFPSNATEALALMLTTMVVAPICEELMFRGYVFRAYEGHRIGMGIVVTSLIFALYHLRLQGVFALIPISIGLGIITWRTQSVLPSMAMHAAYNGISTVIMIATSFLPMRSVGFITGMTVCLSFLAIPVSVLAFLALWKRTEPGSPERGQRERGWLKWAWIIPLIGLAVVYAYGATSELLLGRFPQRLSDEALTLSVPEAWEQPTRLQYEVQNPMGDPLGNAECTRKLSDGNYHIQCSAEYEGFNLLEEFPGIAQFDSETLLDTLDLPGGMPPLKTMLKGDPGAWSFDAEWMGKDVGSSLSLQAFTGTRTLMTKTVTSTLRSEPHPRLVAESTAGLKATVMPEGKFLLMHEWPWRLEGLPFELGYGGPVTLITLNDEGLPISHQAYVQVRGGEPTWAGEKTFITWRVTVTYGQAEEKTLTAWYRSEPPHTLVRYDDGQVSYVLQSTAQVETPNRD